MILGDLGDLRFNDSLWVCSAVQLRLTKLTLLFIFTYHKVWKKKFMNSNWTIMMIPFWTSSGFNILCKLKTPFVSLIIINSCWGIDFVIWNLKSPFGPESLSSALKVYNSVPGKVSDWIVIINGIFFHWGSLSFSSITCGYGLKIYTFFKRNSQRKVLRKDFNFWKGFQIKNILIQNVHRATIVNFGFCDGCL